MFHVTRCPSCDTRFSIPEAKVGTRQICPHCQTPFVVGKGVIEPPSMLSMEKPSMLSQSLASTMLGQVEEMIRYKCPRCQKPLEAPKSEAGVKKPCPACGQRLQVPAPSTPAGDPSLNKTLLAEEQSTAPPPPIHYNCPKCKTPLESPATEAGRKKPCPKCGQRLQIPYPSSSGASNLNKTLLAEETSPTGITPGQPLISSSLHAPSAGDAKTSRRALYIGTGIGGAIFVLLLVLIMTAPQASAARKQYELAQKQLEELKAKELEYQQLLKKLTEDKDREMREAAKRFEEQQKQMQALFEQQLRKYQDENERAKQKQAIEQELQRKLAEMKAQHEAELKRLREEQAKKTESVQKQLNQVVEKQTVVHQAVPVPYYRWHPYYWYGWPYWP
ncbi:MAG: hypothetical protein KatS3mg105_3370 [Gemmatales bacterium]|nr:MAG: hypothetical protein KatS3mg105_3370 [Gemmatales bacterium]